LSTEQIQLINMYNTQYNRTLTQVDRLLDSLDTIRDNIQQVLEQGNSRSQLVRRNRRTNNRNRNFLFSTNPNGTNVNGINVNGINVNGINDNGINDNGTNDNGTNDNTNLFSILRSRTLNPSFVNYLNTVVPVRPTNEQIQNATREVRYRDITNPPNESCPISLDRFESDDLVTQIIHCGHIFCQTEVQEWFQEHVRCPVCRYDIRDYTNTNSSNTNTTSSNTNTTTSSNTNTTTSPNTNTNTTNTTNTNTNTSIPNMTFIRNPTTNQTEQIMFDFEVDNQFNDITSQIIRSLFSQNRI
jgi:hypothetical protein